MGTNLTEKDVADFAATGGTLIRLSFPDKPLMALSAPNAFDESAFTYLERVLDWAEARGLRVLVDPHRFPGTVHPYTMLGTDPFFREFRYHDLATKLWEEIAKRWFAKRGEVVAGYDLLNEPEVPDPLPKGTPQDINLLYSKLIAAIRKHDLRHTIVFAAPRLWRSGKTLSYHYGLALLDTTLDGNLAFETHTYDPTSFTFQGVESRPTGSSPTRASSTASVLGPTPTGRRSTRRSPPSSSGPAVPFSSASSSCARWLGTSGNTWLRDAIETFENGGWSWCSPRLARVRWVGRRDVQHRQGGQDTVPLHSAARTAERLLCAQYEVRASRGRRPLRGRARSGVPPGEWLRLTIPDR